MAATGRKEKVVPIPKAKTGPFSELGPKSAHVNESVYHVWELSESLPSRLVPQIAGTWVFFEARYTMLVGNLN